MAALWALAGADFRDAIRFRDTTHGLSTAAGSHAGESAADSRAAAELAAQHSEPAVALSECNRLLARAGLFLDQALRLLPGGARLTVTYYNTHYDRDLSADDRG